MQQKATTVFNGSLVFVTLIYILLISCGYEKPDALVAVEKHLPDDIDYNFHVKPILSDKCFHCHGPDAENREANLRLDLEEMAYQALESGDGYAIVPGRPGESQLYRRIISEDNEALMPPPDSHLELSVEEKAILAKWIEQGAEYKPHWSFVPPKKTRLPKVQDASWVQQPLDQFILKRLEAEHMKPSDPASKETLIRRVTFDLTGLPPTLEEIDQFMADDSPEAYEKLVDRLLASNAYGERMAADWMDVARYADSDGYLDDKHREFYPWRNWVIEAFNENMPYDQFITWQLAGDQIPEASKESTLATAFNRLHKRNSEAGIVFEEYRVEYVADRTNTLGTGILGLSLECARCHDHKFDPISQKEYYQLFGFFNSTFEMGSAIYGPEQVPGPSLLLSSELEDEQIAEITQMIDEMEKGAEQHQLESKAFEAWLSDVDEDLEIQKGVEQAMVAYYPFDQVVGNQGDFRTSNRLDVKLPAKLIQPIHKEGFKGKGLFVSDYNRITLGEKVGWYDRTDDFSFELAVKPDTIYPEVGILWHCESIRLGLKGYSLHLRDNRVQFVMARAWPYNTLQVTTEKPLPPGEWSHISVTYDGSSKAEGITIYIDGVEQAVDIDYDQLYKSILFEPDIHTYGFSGITLGARDKFIPFKHGGLDEIKIYDRKLSSLEVLYSFSPEQTRNLVQQKGSQKELLRDHFYTFVDEESRALQSDLKHLRDQENAIVTDIKEIMVMGDLPEPRPTYVLDRGVYDARGEQVEPSTPASVLPFGTDFPKNRYGLTQWIFDDENPLTARVYVNRIWQMHFGKGLVSTSDDFGAQGSLPSHPELLDWLAVHFMESDWDIKALHKLVVTSATYMQDSRISDEMLEKDPENILLSRGPRYRMPAEMIRDNALSVSGLLVTHQGGESVYPYQPDGLWDGLTTKHWAYRYLQEDGNGLYRRSLYTIWKRASPPPFMQIFDVNDRGTCIVNRRLSSTPLQALNLLNDPQFVEASRVLAQKLLETEEDSKARLEKAFRLLTGRKPDRVEQTMLIEFYEEELEHFSRDRKQALAYMDNGYRDWDDHLNVSEIAALGVVVNSIMNTSEAYTKK